MILLRLLLLTHNHSEHYNPNKSLTDVLEYIAFIIYAIAMNNTIPMILDTNVIIRANEIGSANTSIVAIIDNNKTNANTAIIFNVVFFILFLL